MNKYINKYKKYNRIYNLLVKELKHTQTKDIDFVFGSNKTSINKINNRYILTFEPSELIKFYKNNTFCDFKGRYNPKKFSLRNFLIVVLYHEIGHKILKHCDYKLPSDNPIYKKLGKKAVYLYPEVIQKQADIYAINKIKVSKTLTK